MGLQEHGKKREAIIREHPFGMIKPDRTATVPEYVCNRSTVVNIGRHVSFEAIRGNTSLNWKISLSLAPKNGLRVRLIV